MLEVLSKPIDEITIADIQSLIDEEVPEGEQIEFKRELPAAKGKIDRWMTRGDDIGDYAKRGILEEVVAFANAYGGVLLIGIEESKTKPSVATKISPVPRCADLADRLKNVFRDCVDPKFVRVDIDRILAKDRCECNDECGCGVVIIRVGKSRLAPHQVRFQKTRICTIRRADRCQEMTMREIQDMTLNVSRGLERLEKRLSERSERFQEDFSRFAVQESAFGIRFTAVPVVDEIRFDRVFHRGRIVSDLDMPWREVLRKRSGHRERLDDALPDFPPSPWQPRLRGTRAERETPDSIPNYLPSYSSYLELHTDGLVELGFLSITDENNVERYLLDPDWPIVMFANLAVWADHIRNKAGAPTAEYALEVETRNLGNAGVVGKFGGKVVHGKPRSLPRLPNTEFPRYPLNDPDDITGLLAVFFCDFWNSMGKDCEDADFILV
ncbi:MAG: putative DNA binding domain-containing protein [Truepera sp.]|nr:putative DNA binding domain-containing protein [Truepera sp.]